MKNVVLVELARKWMEDAEPKGEPVVVETNDDKIISAIAKVERATKRECADTLLTLIDVMPNQ